MSGLVQQFRQAPVRRIDWNATDVESTSVRFLLFVQIPLWIVPGVMDWWWHRRTRIEETAGLQESLIHSLMMAEVGVPILMALVFEINPLLLTVIGGAVVVHSATAVWDVRFAEHHREVRTGEQHTHSFMEVLPFMGLAFACTLHGDATHRLLTGRTSSEDWTLTIKKPRLSLGYLAGVLGLIAVGVALPYAEEAWRCVRKRNTPKRDEGFFPEGATHRFPSR